VRVEVDFSVGLSKIDELLFFLETELESYVVLVFLFEKGLCGVAGELMQNRRRG
jgi:hypothetical protein